MRRELTVAELSSSEFSAQLDQTVAVYAAAMQAPASMLPGRRSTMIGHAVNPGFRALLATEDESGTVAAFTYGFHGAPGQWWHDTVARALVSKHGAAAAAAWLDQGRGIGAGLLQRLTSGRTERTALLSTRDADTPARRLYRGSGFTDLLTAFIFFPSSDPPYAVMGAELPLRPLAPRTRS